MEVNYSEDIYKMNSETAEKAFNERKIFFDSVLQTFKKLSESKGFKFDVDSLSPNKKKYSFIKEEGKPYVFSAFLIYTYGDSIMQGFVMREEDLFNGRVIPVVVFIENLPTYLEQIEYSCNIKKDKSWRF